MIRGLGAQSANPGVTNVTTGGVVDTSGQNWLASLICGKPMYAPGGAAIGTDYCLQYYNEVGFPSPPMPLAPPVPSNVDYADPNATVDSLITDYSASLKQQALDFFNSVDTTDQAIGGSFNQSSTTLWWIIGGVALWLVIEKVL